MSYVPPKIDPAPFLLNMRYGLYNNKKTISPGRYFKILEVIKDETDPDSNSGDLRTLTVKIEYKQKADTEPVVIEPAFISKYSEQNEYTLFYNGGHGGILIPSLVISTEPLQGGGYRNRKSAKKVRRRRQNKTSRRNTKNQRTQR